MLIEEPVIGVLLVRTICVVLCFRRISDQLCVNTRDILGFGKVSDQLFANTQDILCFRKFSDQLCMKRAKEAAAVGPPANAPVIENQSPFREEEFDFIKLLLDIFHYARWPVYN